MLSLTGLSAPGRSAPLTLGSLDPIAIAKLITRLVAFAFLGHVLMHANDNRTTSLLRRLTPLALFTAWAAVSVFWSPMPTVTFGHASELVVMLMLAGAAGLLTLDEEVYSRIFCHLTLIAMTMSVVLIALNFRDIIAGERPMGYMQPNDMAKTGGAGLILFACCHLFWKWKWTRTMFWPASIILSALIFVARSRTASILTPLVILVLCLCFRRVKTVVAICLCIGLFALFLPYSQAVQHVPDSVMSYMARGQSTDELAGLSGRTEMWSIAWESFLDAPFFGHGYYIMTRTGMFQVWGKLQFQTAHNAYLHVVTGLGLLGTCFLIWGLGALIRPSVVAMRDRSRKVELLALLMIAWYCAMGMFELAWFGPVDTAVVIFFVLLGVSAGRPAVAEKPGRNSWLAAGSSWLAYPLPAIGCEQRE